MRIPLLAALVLLAVPAQAQQFSFSPLVGYDLEAEGLMIGLAAEIGAPLQGIPLQPSVRPLVEYVFADADIDVIRANADLIGRFESAPGAAFLPYAKAGLTLEYISVDVPDGVDVDNSDTDLSLNIGGGAEFTRFFLEGEYGFGGIEGFRVRAGYRF